MRLPGLVARPLPQRRSNGRKLGAEFDVGIFFQGLRDAGELGMPLDPSRKSPFVLWLALGKYTENLGLASGLAGTASRGPAGLAVGKPVVEPQGPRPLTDGRLETGGLPSVRPLCGKFCRLCRYISLVFGRLLSFARPDEKLPTWTTN